LIEPSLKDEEEPTFSYCYDINLFGLRFRFWKERSLFS